MTSHKNKTLATLLAAAFGGLGLHRFYLYGAKDKWAWVHILLLPIFLPVLAGFIEALVIGLTPDEKWDAQHNANSGKKSDSRWPLALILVLTFASGTTVLVATLARIFDLLYTGGAYG